MIRVNLGTNAWKSTTKNHHPNLESIGPQIRIILAYLSPWIDDVPIFPIVFTFIHPFMIHQDIEKTQIKLAQKVCFFFHIFQ